MTISFSPGYSFLDQLREALGIPKELGVKRIVIDAEVSGAVLVYVQSYLSTDKAPAVLECLKAARPHAKILHVDDISLDEKGNPHPIFVKAPPDA